MSRVCALVRTASAKLSMSRVGAWVSGARRLKSVECNFDNILAPADRHCAVMKDFQTADALRDPRDGDF
jgi:hypothetical protein